MPRRLPKSDNGIRLSWVAGNAWAVLELDPDPQQSVPQPQPNGGLSKVGRSDILSKLYEYVINQSLLVFFT